MFVSVVQNSIKCVMMDFKTLKCLLCGFDLPLDIFFNVTPTINEYTVPASLEYYYIYLHCLMKKKLNWKKISAQKLRIFSFFLPFDMSSPPCLLHPNNSPGGKLEVNPSCQSAKARHLEQVTCLSPRTKQKATHSDIYDMFRGELIKYSQTTWSQRSRSLLAVNPLHWPQRRLF